MKYYFLLAIFICSNCAYSQNYIDNYLSGSPTYSVIGSAANGLDQPRDLDFKPNSNELWVVNKATAAGGTMCIFYDAGKVSQTSQFRKDSHSDHFMMYPSAIAFGDDGRFSGVSEVQNTNPQTPTFMGPALWSSDTSIYATVFQNNWMNGYPLGSHLDMLHQSPFGMGIAHDSIGMYWVFDGYNGNICKYYFVQDHGPGYEDHSQAMIWRYTDVGVTRVPNIPSHMIKDKATGWLYFVDGGAKKLKRINTNTGSVVGNLTVPPTANEPLLGYYDVQGATVQVLDSFPASQPCGIDLYNGRMIVSDYGTGDIYVYDITAATPVKIGTIATGQTGIMGVKIGTDGKIWFVNNTQNNVVRINPAGNVNDDASILAITAPLLENYETRFYNTKYNQCAPSIAPVVTLENNGANPLTSVTIKYAIDNNPANTYSWSGTLASGATTTVTLPMISIVSGTHKLIAYTVNPNGTADKNPANDRKEGSFRAIDPATTFPFTETFSTAQFPPTGWSYVNYNPNDKVSYTAGVGAANPGSLKMDNFSGAEDITGQQDYLITPRIDMTGAVSNAVLEFEVAYAQYALSSADALTVKASTDCGNTWSQIYSKSGSQLSTSAVTTSAFSPTSPSQWRNESVSLSAYAGQSDVLFMFDFTSNFGNNVFIDDVKLRNTTGVENVSALSDVTIYPNPSTGMVNIHIGSNLKNIVISVFDIVGKQVQATVQNSNSNEVTIDLTNQADGTYFLRMQNGDQTRYQKVTIAK